MRVPAHGAEEIPLRPRLAQYANSLGRAFVAPDGGEFGEIQVHQTPLGFRAALRQAAVLVHEPADYRLLDVEAVLGLVEDYALFGAQDTLRDFLAGVGGQAVHEY